MSLWGASLLAAQAALPQAETKAFTLPSAHRSARRGPPGRLRTGDLPPPGPADRFARSPAGLHRRGWETTRHAEGESGKGGRNTELALAAVSELANFPGVMLVTLATDGEDGPTDAAGAVVTGETYRQAPSSACIPGDSWTGITHTRFSPPWMTCSSLARPGRMSTTWYFSVYFLKKTGTCSSISLSVLDVS